MGRLTLLFPVTRRSLFETNEEQVKKYAEFFTYADSFNKKNLHS